jgi:homoserine dehydrogenase
LLHTHGTELFDLSQKNGCTICIEAAVGGGIPVVAAMTQALTGNRILSIEAILNGIGNITLSRMLDDRQPYEAILAQAQALGFAEADPTMDVDGTDAVKKMAVLTPLAFGTRVTLDQLNPRCRIYIDTGVFHWPSKL